MAQLRCLKKPMVESYQLSGTFWYIAQNIEGIGVLESKFFEQRADEELVIQRKLHLDLCN